MEILHELYGLFSYRQKCLYYPPVNGAVGSDYSWLYCSIMKSKQSKIPLGLLYVLFGIGIVAALVWTSLRAMRETPTREVTLELPGQGWVTFSLTTAPYPPITGEMVSLILTARNRNGVALDLGSEIPFDYGIKGDDTPLGSGDSLEAGARYQAGILFPEPGGYWLAYDIGIDNPVTFQIYVEPGQ